MASIKPAILMVTQDAIDRSERIEDKHLGKWAVILGGYLPVYCQDEEQARRFARTIMDLAPSAENAIA